MIAKTDINAAVASKHYVATLDDVEALARSNRDGQQAVNASAATYLRVLVASVQFALGMQTPRVAAARGKQSEPDMDADAATLGTVHAQLYEAVMRAVVTDDIADSPGLRQAEKTRRSLERNRRSTFARTAKASLSAFIRAGGNVRSLVVTTVTKQTLRAYTQDQAEPVEKLSPAQVAARLSAEIVRRITAIREDNAVIADAALQQVACDLAELASVWNVKSTTSPAKAVAQHIPLRTTEGVFWPAIPPGSA